MGSLLKRVLTRSMFLSDIERLKYLVAYTQQFNRLKFGESAPQEYLDVTRSLERLIPSEMRHESYARYELKSQPSLDFVGDSINGLLAVAASRTLSSTIRGELTRIIGKKMYEPTDLSDVTSTDDSTETPPQ